MRSLLLIIALCIVVLFAGVLIIPRISFEKHPSIQNNDALVITSDSSVGLRAFQGQAAAEGKIVIQNTGKSSLKNIQVKLYTPNDSITLENQDCHNILELAQSCTYSVRYLPHFKVDDKDSVRDQLVTFIATANGEILDDYTMNLQSVANESWFYEGNIYFKPNGGVKIINVVKGNMEILYTFAYGPDDSLSLIRSTDALNLSIVGSFDKNTFSPIGHGLSANRKGIFMSVETNDKQVAIAQYNNMRWHLLKSWDKETMVPNKEIDLLVAENGDLYVGSPNNTNLPPVLKFDGQKWSTLDKNWPHSLDQDKNLETQQRQPWGSLNRLRKFGDTLYAATPKGIVKFDGDKWTLLGTSIAQNQTANSTNEIGAVADLLQLFNGDLYAASEVGIVKYNPTDNRWSIAYEISHNGIQTKQQGFDNGNMLFFNQSLYACFSAAGIYQLNLTNGDKQEIINSSCGGVDTTMPQIFFFKGSLYFYYADFLDSSAMSRLDLAPQPHWQDPTINENRGLSAKTFCAIHQSSPLYEVNDKQIIKKDGSHTTELFGDYFGDPRASLKFANDFFANQTELYAAWGNHNDMKDSRYAYYINCGPMSNSRINYISDKKPPIPNDEHLSSKDALSMGGISKYNVNHWQPIGQESWDKQQLGAATGVQIIDNTVYAAYKHEDIAGVVQYDGKNWLPAGKNTLPKGDFNIVQINNNLYSAWDNCYESNPGDDCVTFYQFYNGRT